MQKNVFANVPKHFFVIRSNTMGNHSIGNLKADCTHLVVFSHGLGSKGAYHGHYLMNQIEKNINLNNVCTYIAKSNTGYLNLGTLYKTTQSTCFCFF